MSHNRPHPPIPITYATPQPVDNPRPGVEVTIYDLDEDYASDCMYCGRMVTGPLVIIGASGAPRGLGLHIPCARALAAQVLSTIHHHDKATPR